MTDVKREERTSKSKVFFGGEEGGGKLKLTPDVKVN
jgi:hypothetical protein